jgi:hypothetical protein
VSSAHGVTSRGGDRAGSSRTSLEMLAVLMLGIGSIATAWCGIQTSRWNGEEARESRDGAIIRIDSSESFALATQLFEYDSNMVSQYARAYADGDDELRAFLRQNLVRPEFLPVLDRWEAAIKAGDAPANLFADEEYIDSLFAESTATAAESTAALARSDEASDNGDDYLLLTLLTATALFFAGLTTSFASRNARLVLISVAAIIITVTAARLIDLPVV